MAFTRWHLSQRSSDTINDRPALPGREPVLAEARRTTVVDSSPTHLWDTFVALRTCAAARSVSPSTVVS